MGSDAHIGRPGPRARDRRVDIEIGCSPQDVGGVDQTVLYLARGQVGLVLQQQGGCTGHHGCRHRRATQPDVAPVEDHPVGMLDIPGGISGQDADDVITRREDVGSVEAIHGDPMRREGSLGVIRGIGSIMFVTGPDADDDGIVGGGRVGRVVATCWALVADRSDHHDAVEPQYLRGASQRTDVVGLLQRRVDRQVDHSDVVHILVVQNPLHGRDRVGLIGHAGVIADPQADQVDLGGDAHVGAIRETAVPADDARDVGAMAVGIGCGGCTEVEGHLRYQAIST